MDVVIGRPVVVRAGHRVSTDDLVEDLRARHDHPKLPVWVRMLRSTGVEWRPWSAPLEETAGRAGVGVRSRAAYEASRDRAVTAAQDALVEAGLGPWEVDVLVTTHTTSWTIPGLDVDLVGRLGLRPDVERVGLATAACVGGGHALVHAVRALRGRSGGRALVVAAEDLSTLYHPDSGPASMQTVIVSGAAAPCCEPHRPYYAAFPGPGRPGPRRDLGRRRGGPGGSAGRGRGARAVRHAAFGPYRSGSFRAPRC
ncbi:hypothetical protein ACH5AG_40850 [Streptomyces anulatus]